ncbi:MAG: M67 family metallopeptidase [Solirubrobacterales bacterium]|nr:M67 family metallopeptidase [Solirubrobacterales bacterium]
MQIAQELLDRVVEHARREAPNECCGFVVLEDGRAVEVIPAENVQASPMRFEVEPRTLLRVTTEVEDAGRELAIYHSHTRSEPRPSQTDIRFAGDWPGVQWLIVGLADGGVDVRNWAIEDGTVSEVEVRVDAG